MNWLLVNASVKAKYRNSILQKRNALGLTEALNLSNTILKIAELELAPAIRSIDQDCAISAGGTSCRHQIKNKTGRNAIHPIRFIRDSLADL